MSAYEWTACVHRRRPPTRVEELADTQRLSFTLHVARLCCCHAHGWRIGISGSRGFVSTAEGWENGPFITLMEDYWLRCRSMIPVCNSNGVPKKSLMKRHPGVLRKRETPRPWLLARCYLFGSALPPPLIHQCVRIEKSKHKHTVKKSLPHIRNDYLLVLWINMCSAVHECTLFNVGYIIPIWSSCLIYILFTQFADPQSSILWESGALWFSDFSKVVEEKSDELQTGK